MSQITDEQVERAMEAYLELGRGILSHPMAMRKALEAALSLGHPIQGEAPEYDPDAPPDHSADNAADFIFKHLSDALGVDGKWSVSDGTETWDGDVAGTLYNILIAAGIWDDENGQLAGPIAWLVGWDENPYGMFARTETEANHVIANLNAYAKGVRTNLRARPLFASPQPPTPAGVREITDEMVKRATIEFLSHKGERPHRVTRGGWELWEGSTDAMRAALAAAKGAGE